jgi:hypothetical protein
MKETKGAVCGFLARVMAPITCILILLPLASGELPSWIKENAKRKEISVYDYATGRFLGSMRIPPEGDPYLPLENTPMENWHPMTLWLGWDDRWGRHWVGFISTSDVAEVRVSYELKKVYILLSGKENTKGKFTLFLSPGFIPSPENVKVYLDNESITNFIIKRLQKIIPDYPFEYLVHVEYSHSIHKLLFDLGTPLPSQGINMILAGAVVAVLVTVGMTIWLRFRK